MPVKLNFWFSQTIKIVSRESVPQYCRRVTWNYFWVGGLNYNIIHKSYLVDCQKWRQIIRFPTNMISQSTTSVSLSLQRNKWKNVPAHRVGRQKSSQPAQRSYWRDYGTDQGRNLIKLALIRSFKYAIQYPDIYSSYASITQLNEGRKNAL